MGIELLLLKIAAFLRPLFFIEVGQANLFDLGAIAIFSLLTFAFLSNLALSNKVIHRAVSFTPIDMVIFAFVVWCLSIYFIYMDVASFRETAKLIIPLLMYTIGKNVMRTRVQYLQVLGVMILGFVPPVVASAVLTALGKGVEFTNYWTGAPRYEGVYAGGHSLGHNMTFFAMLITVYVTLSLKPGSSIRPRVSHGVKILLAVLALAAAYCLVMTRVRTAILGLAVFLAVLLWKFNKKLLLFGGAAVLAVVLVLKPIVLPFMFPDLVMIEKGGGDITDLGSGRPELWAENLSVFASLPLDKQIAGAGIGSNKRGVTADGPVDSHNDYMDLLVETGVVGLALFLAFQLLLLSAIWKTTGMERYVFLGVWMAVFVMNFVSNSYVSRFGLAQMFYLVLAYLELPGEQRSAATKSFGAATASLARTSVNQPLVRTQKAAGKM